MCVEKKLQIGICDRNEGFGRQIERFAVYDLNLSTKKNGKTWPDWDSDVEYDAK